MLKHRILIPLLAVLLSTPAFADKRMFVGGRARPGASAVRFCRRFGPRDGPNAFVRSKIVILLR